MEPVVDLAGMALDEKQPDVALNRVTRQIALVPKSAGLQYLLGVVHLARRETTLAEAAFLKGIELDPNLVDAYVRLGGLYKSSGRYDEALAKLNDALRVNPRALAAQMLVGVIYESKGDPAKAQQAYEKALTLNPRFAPAANNLAWLYSQREGDKEKALELAQRAKEAAPHDPHVSDTLGWILYQRGVYQRAVGFLRESATKLPDNPVVQYHFGLASLKTGDRDSARRALSTALRSPVNFAGKEEARRALSELQ